jgi:ClpP class serine protease
MLDPRFCHLPLAIHPQRAEALLAAGRADSLFGEPPASARGDSGYDLVAGVAVIGVRGVLMPRLGTLRPWGDWATGYDGIAANFRAALADAAARAIVLSVDSPGGDVADLIELAETIYLARGDKPIVAIVDGAAHSAAYWLASAADFITVPVAGSTGSIGVITGLTDFSGALEKAGIAAHFVTFGRDKAAASRAQYTGVTKEVLAGIQADVDVIGEMFVASVARNRAIAAAAVRAQEARCFMGEAGVAAGLANRVLAPAEAFQALLADLDAA